MASHTDTPAPAAPASADAIILFLGREIGRLFNEQQQLEARRTTDPMTQAYLDREITQISDRISLTQDGLSTVQATSAAAAAIQCAAAYSAIGALAMGQGYDPGECRALMRLLASVNHVLIGLAADGMPAWSAAHGVTYLFEAHTDPWRTVDDQLAAARAEMGA